MVAIYNIGPTYTCCAHLQRRPILLYRPRLFRPREAEIENVRCVCRPYTAYDRKGQEIRIKPTFASWLHPRSRVHSVAEETVPRHCVSHHSCRRNDTTWALSLSVLTEYLRDSWL